MNFDKSQILRGSRKQGLLEEILSKDPGNEKAKQKLGSLKNLLAPKHDMPRPEDNKEGVARELSRWLMNLERTRGRGA